MLAVQKFRTGVVQMSCSTDPKQNLAKAEARVIEAAQRGAQVICLQELFGSQYFCRDESAELFDLAESIPGPSTKALGKLAKSLSVVIIASLFEKRAHGLYHNTAAILGTDGEIMGLYRKMHIPDRRRAAYGDAGRQYSLLSDCDRLAPGGKGRIWPRAA
jgi:N-carbamoylputrescine amidase